MYKTTYKMMLEWVDEPLYVFVIPLCHKWKVDNKVGFTINLWKLKIKFKKEKINK